jgi:hypothetical protein
MSFIKEIREEIKKFLEPNKNEKVPRTHGTQQKPC